MNDDASQSLTRIQRQNRKIILQGALTAFSDSGFRGTTIDQIAEAAGLSKPNVLYYFATKESIHKALLTEQLDMWLAPLQNIDPDGEPMEQMLLYVRAKLEMSRKFPRESRLFAYEVISGAPHLTGILRGRLRKLVDVAAAIVQSWMDQGKLRKVDPYHLIFSVWAMTQHYADFEVQVTAVLGSQRRPFNEAQSFLDDLYRRLLEI